MPYEDWPTQFNGRVSTPANVEKAIRPCVKSRCFTHGLMMIGLTTAIEVDLPSAKSENGSARRTNIPRDKSSSW